ncbi:MAG: aldo/keto reductase [Xanthobacter sp.]
MTGPRPLTTLGGQPLGPAVFGAMQCGDGADEAASHAMFEASLEAGIRHFDTAHAYTGGASEQLVGAFAAPRREQLFVATKVGLKGGAGRQNLTSQFDVSRRRLGLDQVDLLYLHRFDPDTPLEETMEVFAEFHHKGWVRHFGLSNFAAWQVMKAVGVAERLGLTVDVIQPMFSLVKRQAEVELLPMARSEGMTACTYSPLGGGLLTGKYVSHEGGRLTRDPKYSARYAPAWMFDAAAALSRIAQKVGVHPATLAVAWVLHHPCRPVPIVSGKSTQQLQPSLEGLRHSLSPEMFRALSQLTPAPAPATDRLEEV